MKQGSSSNLPVVVITGASSGIGEAAAIRLAESGFRVVIAARRIQLLERVAEKIRSGGGEVLPIRLDLTDFGQIKNLVEETMSHFGRIDVLINNAGSARHLWLDEQRLEEDILKQLQVNLVGMIQLTRLILPDMINAGSGQIIHISSIASWVGIPTYSIYNASKFGSRGFYAGLRRELRGRGITVSEIFPGAVDTEFGHDPDIGWKNTTVTPRWALLSTEDVAEKILQTIRNKRKKLVIPWFMRLAIWADSFFPAIVSWLLSQYFYEKDGVRYSWKEQKGSNQE